MPFGYRVSLGDGQLTSSDAISDPWLEFTTDTVIGAGEWIWSGTFNTTTFTDEVEPGVYYLGTDGFVYFVPDLGRVTTVTSSSVQSAPSFDASIFGTTGDDPALTGTGGDDRIYGGDDRSFGNSGNDTIDAGDGDDTVFAENGDDSVFGGHGDDTIQGNNGADTLIGGTGSDTLSGGGGDDVLDGGGQAPVAATSESLNWSAFGADETDIDGGVVQSTGTMDVTFTYSDDGGGTEASVESSSTQYTAAGEPFSTTSSLQLSGNGAGATSTVYLDFTATPGSGMTDEVENISFRINDVDTGGWQDQMVVTAFDADGNPVTVTLTPAGDDTVSGNTITAGPGNDQSSQPDGSVLVEIAGPVRQIVLNYSNLGPAGQIIFVTDVHFDTIPDIDGADSLIGGDGDDLLTLADGDTGLGGDGDDTFALDASALTGGGVITIVGGEGGETDGDVLDLSAVSTTSITYTNTDDAAGGLSGTATLADGTIVNFSEIETIICFTAGTAIQTPSGERRIENLKAGDLVLTLDNGPQRIRWIGNKTVRATGSLAPIRFSKGSIGNHRDLLVSPQHRILCGGYMTQLHFGESEVLAPAKSLVDEFGVTVAYGGMVTYYHMLFDRHEIVLANGAPSESFFPGGYGLDTLNDPARDEIFRLFPELRSNVGAYGPASRVCVKDREARVLLTA